MKNDDLGAAFIHRLANDALTSTAVDHPYLHALCTGNLPDVTLAFKDFAFYYGQYSSKFTCYVSAIIKALSSTEHKKILLANLAEEQGDTAELELPFDVLVSVVGQPHASLYRRFQEAIGVNADYHTATPESSSGNFWSQNFLQLCEMNECVGIGAIGIGTELIVSRVYSQILEGLKLHTDLTMSERVFFDLHSVCDDEHANQMLSIAEDLAQNQWACEQIEYGAKMAINMRAEFWDKMLSRAQSFACSVPADTKGLSNIGYSKSL